VHLALNGASSDPRQAKMILIQTPPVTKQLSFQAGLSGHPGIRAQQTGFLMPF
jgi:hypothetical protein